MSILKRTFRSIYAQVDQLVGEIENHDALIKAAIDGQRKKLASAKVQLARVQGRERRLQAQIEQLQSDGERWRQRAVADAASDEQQALVCLQRRQALQQQVEKLQLMQGDYHQTAERMEGDIRRCDDELKGLSRKHELLKARQSTSEALTAIHDIGGSRVEELETSFERWESTVIHGEMLNDDTSAASSFAVDSVERGYVDRENEQQLRAELADLLMAEKLETDKQQAQVLQIKQEQDDEH